MSKLARLALPILLAAGPLSVAYASPQQDRPTADNQPNNTTDRKMTAEIRRAVVQDKSLSTAAHNVKIITQGGQVTLRGRVKSEDERRTIVAKAEEIAGKGKVTDQLQLTTGTSSHDKNPNQ